VPLAKGRFSAKKIAAVQRLRRTERHHAWLVELRAAALSARVWIKQGHVNLPQPRSSWLMLPRTSCRYAGDVIKAVAAAVELKHSGWICNHRRMMLLAGCSWSSAQRAVDEAEALGFVERHHFHELGESAEERPFILVPGPAMVTAFEELGWRQLAPGARERTHARELARERFQARERERKQKRAEARERAAANYAKYKALRSPENAHIQIRSPDHQKDDPTELTARRTSGSCSDGPSTPANGAPDGDGTSSTCEVAPPQPLDELAPPVTAGTREAPTAPPRKEGRVSAPAAAPKHAPGLPRSPATPIEPPPVAPRPHPAPCACGKCCAWARAVVHGKR
jgi:hypothetical protein